VAEELLDRARAEGPDAVAGEVRAVLDRAVAQGARAVLCTRSTIGSVADAVGTSAWGPLGIRWAHLGPFRSATE